jgi:hypothetical protein
MTLEDLMLGYAKFIDNVDLYLGPLSSLTKQGDDDFLQSISLVTKTASLSLKIPFMAAYLLKKRDLEGVIYLCAKETFSVVIPYGGFIEMMRSYEKIMKK